jgi:hypothetical protein
MKTIYSYLFALLLLLPGLSTAAQQLMKMNYAIHEVNEAISDIAIAGADLAKQAKAEDDKKKAKGIQLDQYSSLATNFAGVAVLPAVKIEAYLLTPNNKSCHQLSLFSGGTTIDSALKDKGLSIFYPDASRFGAHYTGVFGLSKKDKLQQFAFRTDVFYLGKNIETPYNDGKDSGTTTNTGHMLQGRLAVEWSPAPQHINLYAGINLAYPLTKLKEFRQVFKYNRDYFAFVDVGISGRLQLADEGAKPDMYIQFGAIINGGDAQSITGSSDRILPYLRMGLQLHLKSIKK